MYSTAVVNTEFLRNFNDEATLEELAEQIREAHAATQNLVANALAAIFAAGEALIAARSRVAKGDWQHWLRTCCSIPLSTAKLYVQITEHRAEIEAALKKDPCLSLRAARLLIAKPKSPLKPSTKTDDQQPPTKRPKAKAGAAKLIAGRDRGDDADRGDAHDSNHGDEQPAAAVTSIDLQARIHELAHEVRVRDIRICGLENDIVELKTTAASWMTCAITSSGDLSAARLVELLQYRLETDGVDAFDLLQKLRARIDRKPPKMTIDLTAVPAIGEA